MTELTNDELIALMAETPGLQRLDVRTPDEYYGLGHIEGFALCPVQTLPHWLPTLNPAVPVVVTCEHGVRSRYAAEALEQAGFSPIYNLTHGMAAWEGERQFG